MNPVVIKLGGSVLVDATLRRQLLQQLVEIRDANRELILVHGGGKQIAHLLEQLKIESHFHDGLRITDEKTRDVVQMVLAGKVGKDLVAELASFGIEAAGITGGDGLSFLASRVTAADRTDLGFVGEITESRPRLISTLLAAGIVPVIACLALGMDDWSYYNVNGDQMAAAVAAACKASQLVFVTDVGGVRGEDGEQIASLSAAGIRNLLATGVASGGMRPKLRACLEALAGGIEDIRIVGASHQGCLRESILDRANIGTAITT